VTIDWTAPLQTKDGRRCTLIERAGWQDAVGDDRRRVIVPIEKAQWPTVYLFHEDGTCGVAGLPSKHDLENIAERAAA
jgi:hypothetical protein